MEITIKISEELAAKARARGISVELYVQEILAQKQNESNGQARAESVDAAIGRIRELRKGNKLQGLSIKDLIHEGHKY
ncbi:MAG TPA: hypothetical protein VKP58_14605 [Candidatus Acidoferrum sp.]|nr:hypothetical protein [Candidatus Acidoferrum sp.]